MRRLTKEQAERIEREMNALHSDGQKQLREWKDAMIGVVAEIRHKAPTQFIDLLPLKTDLKNWIEQITLKTVTVNGKDGVVIYDFPDELADWLEAKHPELLIPGVLLNCLDGSVQVEPKQAAEPVRQPS